MTIGQVIYFVGMTALCLYLIYCMIFKDGKLVK
jgi:hypothetical protein